MGVDHLARAGGNRIWRGFEPELTNADKDLKFVPIQGASPSAHQYCVAMPAMAETSLVKQFLEIRPQIRDQGVSGFT